MSRKEGPVVFSKERFEQKIEDNAKWSLTYKMLRELCGRFPNHSCPNANYAKLIFVNRGYAAGLDRKGIKPRDLASYMAKHHKTVDDLIAALPKSRTLGGASTKGVLDVHWRFVAFLSSYSAKRVGKKLSFRSFASKYLHFHRVSVPIFDSIASRELNRQTFRRRTMADLTRPITMPSICDPIYASFVRKFLALTDLAINEGCAASVARVDRYLWKPPD
jgi:hypothetical protein